MLSSVETHIPFCEEWLSGNWDHRERDEQESYVLSELNRIVEEGKPLLRAVLTCTNTWAKFLAIKFLNDGQTSAGEPAPAMPGVYLRLVAPEALDYEHPGTGEVETAAALPPVRDPQGRMLPKPKQGNTLVAKVGNRGGKLDGSADPRTAMIHGGENRFMYERTGRDIYDTIELNRTPKLVKTREAVIIMSQWGYGVSDTPFRPLRTEKQGVQRRGQCTWLVEELSEGEAMETIMRAKLEARAAEKAKADVAAEKAAVTDLLAQAKAAKSTTTPASK